MVVLTYSDVHHVMQLTVSDLTAVNTEYLIDLAIDLLNLYGAADLTNLAGVAGAKTVTVTSAQRGAILLVVRALYHSFPDAIHGVTVSGLSMNPMDVLANPVMVRLIRDAAHRLTATVPFSSLNEAIE